MVDRNWLLSSLSFAPLGTLGALLSLWFVTVFAKSTHIPRVRYTKKIHMFSVYARIQHSSWAVQSITTLRSVLETLSRVVKMSLFSRKFGTSYSHPVLFVVVFALLLPAVWCSCVSYFWPCTPIKSLWPKQGIDLLSLQHGSVSVFGGEQSWLWDMVFGSSEALRSDFNQNLYWE